MSARTLRFLAIPGVALALAAPAARGQDAGAVFASGSLPTRNWVLGDGQPIPSGFGNGAFQFPNEMSALSWNFLTLLVLWSGDFDPDDPYARFDPSDPATSRDEGKCSFAQPQYCSSIQALFGTVSPPAPPPAVVRQPAIGSVRGGAVRGGVAAAPAAGMRGRPVPPSRPPAVETTRRVDPQLPLRPSVPPEGGDPPGAPGGVFDPDGPRAGGNGSFGRRDFVWHQQTPPGCLPPRSGLSGLSSWRIGTSAAARARAQRPGRCPPR